MTIQKWNQKIYEKIIFQYNKKKNHPLLIIKSCIPQEISFIIYKISKFLLCKKPIYNKYCNVCFSCILMDSKKHPDFYNIMTKKYKISIGIDEIRLLIKNLYTKSQQGGKKIIHIKDTELLTEEASNTLLRICEEPPEKTFFILQIYNSENISMTLRSRALFYNISTPSEKKSIKWILENIHEKKKYKKNIITALRICNGSIYSALYFLNNFIRFERENLIKILKIFFNNFNMIKLIEFLEKKNTIQYINWINYFIFDALKFLCMNKTEKLFNKDHIDLIKKISFNFNIKNLCKSLKIWIKCIFLLKKKIPLKKNIIIAETVLSWKELII